MISIFTTLSYPAVNCYVLITGYFSWKSVFDLKKQIVKLIKLWFSLIFFNILGYLFVSVVLNHSFSLIDFLLRFIPLIRGNWWFMTVYCCLIMILPFLNVIVSGINKQRHFSLLFILFVCFSIVPLLNGWEDKIGTNYGYSLIWFITLYFSGSYISKYELFNGKNKSLYCFLTYMGISALIYIIGAVIRKAGFYFNLSTYNSPFTYFQSIFLFMAFCSLRNKISKGTNIISYIATLSLASYLLHCQNDVESVLWSTLNPSQYANDYRIVIVYIILIVLILSISMLLEGLRRIVFKGIENRIYNIFMKS